MRLVTLLAKLRGRSFDEVRERLAQQATILAERTLMRDAGEPDDGTFRHRLAPSFRDGLTAAGAVAKAVRVLRDGPRPRFFPGIDRLPETLAIGRERWPACVDDAVRAGDEIVAGRFSLLGHAPLHLADPIDWSRDHLLHVSAPHQHWSTIAYLDPAVAGDHKLVWELNRHQWLVTLGMAYAYTGEERYAARAAQLLEAWLDANPPKQGVNWASSLEVAYRAIAWLWALRLMARAPAFSDELLARWLKVLEVSARHIERFLSTWFSPNTHLTGEALGLLYLGTQLPELAGSSRWRDRGWAILLAQLSRHVRPDGSYFEQATYYQRYTIDIYVHARVLASAHGLCDVARVDDALRRLAGFVTWIARADGTMPLFGDEDGGRLLYLDARDGDDVRSPVLTAAALTGEVELASAGAPATHELVWLLGPEGVARIDRLVPRRPAESARAFRDGGFYVMRDGWEATAAVLTVDCGPLGVDNGGHAHADTLAFDLALGSRPIFVDAGTVSYTTSSDERDEMRSSLVHNTVSLNAESSSVPAGAFRWAHMVPGVLDTWHTTPAGALFEGHHDGYARLSPPARHRRLILAARHGWWLVRDVIEPLSESRGGHVGVATFQCASGLDLVAHGTELQVNDDGRRMVTVHALGAGGHWELGDGIASRCYGSRETARRARFVFRTDECSAVTFAMTRGEGTPCRVTHAYQATGDVVCLTSEVWEDVVTFGSHDVVPGLRTDARAAWVRRRASDGTIESLLAIGGTVVELDGVRLADTHGGVVSAVREQDGWRLVHSDGGAVPQRRAGDIP